MRGFLAAALLWALALPAKADIVDGGSLQIGGQGLFGGTVTVQGNALGVAGGVSATSASLSGSGAQIYSLTTSSGIHVINGKLKLDSGAMIQWPDNTVSTTAPASFASLASTQTTIPRVSFSNTSWNSVSGSTITFTTSHTSRLQFDFDCVCYGWSAGVALYLGVLVNGAYIEQESATGAGLLYSYAASSVLQAMCGFHFLTKDTYAAGSYSVSLVKKVDSGTGELLDAGSGTASCKFRGAETLY